MKNRMQASVQHYQSLAGWHAENLLKAWLTGDAAKLDTELERSLMVPFEANDAGEEERRHLLQAVAKRMSQRPDLLEPWSQSPELGLYVRLLWHMVPREEPGSLCA
jgi:hypothetical protein